MPRAEDCRYTKEHEWVYLDGDLVTLGITDFAQQELGDIVFIDLGDTGRELDSGAEIGTIESVKAVAEVYAPISGSLEEVNPLLEASPEKVNEEPLEAGWLAKMKPSNPSELEALMSFDQYKAFLEDQG